MTLSVTVLGCDGSYAGAGGACSGYLVQGAGLNLWVDAGPGTLANLQRHVTLSEVDAVVLSHEHPDHWHDLEGLAVACYHALGRTGVPVYAPPALRSLVYHYTHEVFSWTEVADGDVVDLGGVVASFSRTDHGPVTLAVRFDSAGRSVGYSADSGPGWSLEALGPDLDLAICEATYTKQDEGRLRHMSARQAGTSACEARVDHLVLTHKWTTVDPEAVMAEGSEAFGQWVDLAEVNARYRV
ncbi:MAG: MBL fold metallo-hydrolase [Mycobacterium sp.]